MQKRNTRRSPSLRSGTRRRFRRHRDKCGCSTCTGKPVGPVIKKDAEGLPIPPRLAKARGILGPEWYGSINTGRRPMIYHAKSGVYVVGFRNDVDDFLPLQYSPRFQHKRVIHLDDWPKDRKVYRFKTRGPAVEQFKVLCREVLQWNRKQQQEHEQAIAEANSPTRVSGWKGPSNCWTGNPENPSHDEAIPNPADAYE
jgi:hypothetical protein